MNLADFIYQEGDKFYFDTETYNDETSIKLSVDYEDGDKILWKVDGKRYSGILREVGANNTLFVLDKITLIE